MYRKAGAREGIRRWESGGRESFATLIPLLRGIDSERFAMIFYFSATGNSQYVAERIAAETQDETVSITECM